MDLFSRAQRLLQQIEQFDSQNNAQAVEKFRIDYIGSKGAVKELLAD